MALQKTKTIKGYDASYWRILQLNCNFDRPDAVVTFGLYKDKATRETDAGAIVDQYQIDLASDLLGDVYANGEDTVKNIKLKEAYKVFKAKAIAEAAKEVPETPEAGEARDEALAWFADAEDA